MANPEITDDFTEDLETLAQELATGSESYVPRLLVILNNMDERRYYPEAKNNLREYIRLFSISEFRTRTAKETEILQALGEKLRGKVIPERVYAGSNLPEHSGEVIDITRERLEDLIPKPD